ncbi:MAG: hypothetical protein M1821_002973 [Bathelium mastoideum]|nr:MAG: hypothetical protein M1821_002973 [Bathelium mastoideum]
MPSLSITTTAANNSQICCFLYVNLVAINFWYNGSLEYTKETLVTKFAQYDTTVVPSTTLTFTNNVTNPYSYGTRVDELLDGPDDQYSFSNVPNILGFDMGWYGGTAVDSSTIWHDNHTSITSPTPFVVVSVAAFATGSSSGTECINVYTNTNFMPEVVTETVVPDPDPGSSGDDFFEVGIDHPQIILDPPWYWLPGSDGISSLLNLGQEPEISTFPGLLPFIASQPSVRSKYPFLTECDGGVGAGAATVHIPVAELTVETAMTIPVGGNYDGGGQGGGGDNTVGGASGRLSTTGGDPPLPTQIAQPHITTQAVISSTATIASNFGSTLTVKTGSVDPASPPESQPFHSASPQRGPQLTKDLGNEAVSSGQPQSQRSDSVSYGSSGYGGTASQPAGAEPNGHTVTSIPLDPQYGLHGTSSITTITLGTAVITVIPTVGSALAVNDQTLLPGNAITMIQDNEIKTISVPPDGLMNSANVDIVDSMTYFDGVVLTLSSVGVEELVVGGTILTPGGPAIVHDGVTISEAANGDVLMVSGQITTTVEYAKDGGGLTTTVGGTKEGGRLTTTGGATQEGEGLTTTIGGVKEGGASTTTVESAKEGEGLTSTGESAKESGSVGYYIHTGIGGSTTYVPTVFMGEGVRVKSKPYLRLGMLMVAMFGIGAFVL